MANINTLNSLNAQQSGSQPMMGGQRRGGAGGMMGNMGPTDEESK